MTPLQKQELVESNKKIVVEAYEAMLNSHDIEAAVKHFGQKYIQHNPTAPDGLEGFRPFFTSYIEAYPNSSVRIKRVFGEGDFVILHVHLLLNQEERGRAAVEIFRLENRKIVEHWDIIQSIPEKSANSNTMF